MAKKNPEVIATEDSPYLAETPKAKKSFKDAFSSRGAKIGAVAAGSALALGAAFGIGLTAGHAQGPAFGHDQMGQGHFGPDRDGDRHGGNFGPQGGQPGQPGQPGQFGDRDGDRGGKFAPNGQLPVDPNAPAPIAPAPTATN